MDTLSSSLGYTISHQALVTDYFLARLRLDPNKTLSTLLPTLLEDEVPIVFKQAFVNSCLAITMEEKKLPWNPSINQMYDAICTPLRRIFIQTVKLELSSGGIGSGGGGTTIGGTTTIVSTSNAPRSDVQSIATSGSKRLNAAAQNSGVDKKLQNVAALLQNVLKLFRLDPLTALLVSFSFVI